MVSTTAVPRSPERARIGERIGRSLRRLVPSEGWATLALHLVLVMTAAWTIQRAEWSPPLRILTLAALGGFVYGLIVAKWRIIDLVAHISAIVFGIVASGWLTMTTLDDVAPGRRERAQYLIDLVAEWYRGAVNGRPRSNPDLFVLVLCITVWLMAFSSAWVMYRRSWLLTAIVLPAIIVVINLGYSGSSTAPLIVFVAASCILATRHHAFRRERDWSRARMLRPERLPLRFLSAGANIALLVAALGATLPTSGREAVSAAVWDRLEQPWESVERQWKQALDRFDGGETPAAGSFSSFGDKFRLGGPLELGDRPVAVLRSPDPAQPIPSAYLYAQRYDDYDGHGWATEVESTFDAVAPDGKRYSPQMTFASGQGIYLSTQITNARHEAAAAIELLDPPDDLLLTMATHLSIEDRRTSVQLSWRQLENERIPVGDVTDADVPPDLRRLVRLLKQAEFGPGNLGATSPPPTDDTLAGLLAAERSALESRFLRVRWEVDGGGRIDLFVTGQIPVYDDVEAVFAEEPPSDSDTYRLKSLESHATPAELQRASGSYPPTVRDRYLPLPGTVTERTRQLARDIVGEAGATNPFDQAIAIQNYVRDAITYEEQIEVPPSDQDVVDFVLFDSKEGYCEYYASAMAVMMRTLGVPARVAVGFFPAEFDPASNGYLYRERNAHAWVEVYFPTYGWLPFEPTQSQPALDYGGDPVPPDVVASPEPIFEPTPTPTPTTATAVATSEPTATPPLPVSSQIDDRDDINWLGWVSIAALAVATIALAVGVAWSWGLRGLSPAASLFSRAIRLGRWWGVQPRPSDTPAEYAARLGRAVPPAAAPAQAVAQLYAIEQYAERPTNPTAASRGRLAWRDLRRVMIRSFFRRRRGGEDDV